MEPGGALTLGVEEEFLLVDRHGHLADRGPEVSDGVPEPLGQVEYELSRCQVEAATDVCTSMDEIVQGLRDLRAKLAIEAGSQGLRLLPSGVAPLAEARRIPITPKDRYQRMEREFGALAQVSLTCACHVHIGIADRSCGLVISNRLRPWLPVLLALTANSPFHDGVDTRHASWRRVTWSRWPSSGPPPYFESVERYESLVDALLRTGAILDRGMIYWDVRLSDHEPTLEVRISDVAATVEEAVLLAVLVRGLAGRALDEGSAPGTRGGGPSREVLAASLWRAARDGLSGHCVDPDSGALVPTWRRVDDLVRHVRPQLRSTGDEEFVTETLARLRAEGGGAQRQRAAFARRNRLTDVVDELVWPVEAG